SRTARASVSDQRSSMRLLLGRRIHGEDNVVTTALAGRLRAAAVGAALHDGQRTPRGAPQVEGQVQPLVAHRATRVPFAGRGTASTRGAVTGSLISVNSVSQKLQAVHV